MVRCQTIMQRFAQLFALLFLQRFVLIVGQQKDISHLFTIGGDARIVQANVLLQQRQRDQ